MGKKQESVHPDSRRWQPDWLAEGAYVNYLVLFFFATLSTIAGFYFNKDSTAALVRMAAVRFANTNDIDRGAGETSCDLFSGKWVFDNNSYPMYRDWNCSFIIANFACEKYRRKDLDYQHWRWQPDKCNLPKFDAKALLEKLRNKRLLFVGDSLNRNQWSSLACLIESSIPRGFKSRVINGSLIGLRAKEYNASVDFYWAPLLVESNSDDAWNHKLPDRIVSIQSIEKHAKHWTDADILIFNSYLWWRLPKLKVIIRGSIGSSNATQEERESRECYKMVLNTWSKWVLTHVNSSKTRLFWISMSPTHTR